MANPFLVGDTTSTFTENNNTFNPFLTSTSAELESHNDNPFFSSLDASNSVQDNTNPFLAFTSKPEPPSQPVADLLGFNEKPQAVVTEDASKMKPPPPRPAPPKRPPPRPTPPTQDAKELILSVTGEMEATSLHLLDRLAKTPSPTPIRDLLSPSPTPTADLLGYDDLQPPMMSQTPSVFDQRPDVVDIPPGTKPERPKLPPKIDYLMDELLEDVPIDEGAHREENFVPTRTPSIPENPPIVGGSKPPSRKSSNEFIPQVRRLSHDVTESRKIMPDLSKIADRRKSDIGHFAPILPSRKPVSQSDQSLQENKTSNVIQETQEPDDKPSVEVVNASPKDDLDFTEKNLEQEIQEKRASIPTDSNTSTDIEKNGVDEHYQHEEYSDEFKTDTAALDAKLTPSVPESSPFECASNENISFNVFDINATIRPSESFPTFSDEVVEEKSNDAYEEKPIPPVPDPSPFQEIPSQETPFDAVFQIPEHAATSAFSVNEPPQVSDNDAVFQTPEQLSASSVFEQEPQASETVIPTTDTVAEPFPTSTETVNDAFDAFAAKFDDSQNDNASGGAFDAFGSVSTGAAFEDSAAMGFGADDNFDSFLSTHQIPAAPQSTPARVTRNNSGESLDENDFNVYIRYALLTSKIVQR